MHKIDTDRIIYNGAVAAIYFLLTFFNPLSFGLVQVRVAEILCLLCFFRKDYCIGVTIGCVLSNIGSKLGFLDIFIGGGATLISCLLISYASKWLWEGCLFTVLINGIVVGLELHFFLEIDLLLSILGIVISEFITLSVGYILFILLKEQKCFLKLIGANQHLDWKW